MAQIPLSDEKKEKLARFQQSIPSESDPPYWRFVDGEQLTGIIEATTTRVNAVGVKQDVLEVLDQNGSQWSVWVNCYMKKVLAARKATIGSMIDIQVGGKGLSESGHEYNVLNIHIENSEE